MIDYDELLRKMDELEALFKIELINALREGGISTIEDYVRLFIEFYQNFDSINFFGSENIFEDRLTISFVNKEFNNSISLTNYLRFDYDISGELHFIKLRLEFQNRPLEYFDGYFEVEKVPWYNTRLNIVANLSDLSNELLCDANYDMIKKEEPLTVCFYSDFDS